MISVLDINDAFTKVKNKLVRYRYVIDLSSMSQVAASTAIEIADFTHILALDKYAKILVPELQA